MRILFSTLLLFLVALNTFAENLVLKIGQISPELNFTRFESTDNKRITFDDFKDHALVLDFWASWCGPCIQAIPHVNSLVKASRNKKVTFISITYETRGMLRKFLRKHRMESIVGIDNDFAMFRSFKAWGIPMVILIDKNRKVAGVIQASDLTEKVVDDVIAGRIPKVDQHPGWNDPEGAEKYFRSLVRKLE